jgi:hypothetical protein
MKKPLVQVPHVYLDRMEKLSPVDLAKIRTFLTSPEWVRFLRVIAANKPSSNVAGGGSRDRDAFSDARTNARLGEIRGWELYEHAIFLALNEPKAIRKAPEEDYPEAGLLQTGPAPVAPKKK